MNLRPSPIWRHAYHRAADYALAAAFSRRVDLRSDATDHSARATIRIICNRRLRELAHAELIASNHGRIS